MAELTEDVVAHYSGIHATFGPVFLSHLLSPTATDRRNILKLLQEWLIDEATELPDGLMVMRTGKVAFPKLDVLRSAAAVCVQVIQDPEEEVMLQGCRFLKAVLAGGPLMGRLKHADVSAELRPVVAALAARLGDPNSAVRHAAYAALLGISRRGPATVYVNLVVHTLAVWPAPEDPQVALGTLYLLLLLVQAFGLKGVTKPSTPSGSPESPTEPKRTGSAGGLVPGDRVVLFAGACLARGPRDVLQPCARTLADLARLAPGQVEAGLAKWEEPHQSDVRRILQHSPNLSAVEDARAFFAAPGGGSPGRVSRAESEVAEDDDLVFNSECRITRDLLVSSSKLTRHKAEPLRRYLERVLTLSLENRGIDFIDNLQHCPQLQVLYLYDNQLTRIQNLNFAGRLTHLYLNNNSISTLDGLQALRNLRKLYLNYNCIADLAGLGPLAALQELHLSHQRLPPGQGLELDGPTLHGLQRLEVLALAGDGLTDIAPLRHLGALRQLDVTHNQIAGLEGLRPVLQHCGRLRDLQVHDNPVAIGKYLDDLVLLSGPTLTTIDHRTITAKEREFLRQLKGRRPSGRPRATSLPPAGAKPGLPPVQGREMGVPHLDPSA